MAQARRAGCKVGAVRGSSPAGGAGNVFRVILFQQLLGLVIAGGVLHVYIYVDCRTANSQHLQDVSGLEYVNARLSVAVVQDKT